MNTYTLICYLWLKGCHSLLMKNFHEACEEDDEIDIDCFSWDIRQFVDHAIWFHEIDDFDIYDKLKGHFHEIEFYAIAIKFKKNFKGCQ